MFGLTDFASGSSSKRRKLRSNLPLEVYLLDAGIEGLTAPALQNMLIQIGRLFDMTKLLDMIMTEEDVPINLEQFFAGKGCFVSAAKEQDTSYV